MARFANIPVRLYYQGDDEIDELTQPPVRAAYFVDLEQVEVVAQTAAELGQNVAFDECYVHLRSGFSFLAYLPYLKMKALVLEAHTLKIKSYLRQ